MPDNTYLAIVTEDYSMPRLEQRPVFVTRLKLVFRRSEDGEVKKLNLKQ